MGFDAEVFVETVDEELMCSICTDVLEEAVQVMPCQHLFCGRCLREWWAVKRTCPVDGLPVCHTDVTPAPRSVQNMLAKLRVRCDRCHQAMQLCRYRAHDCFQEILALMNDYIQQIDGFLTGLAPNPPKSI